MHTRFWATVLTFAAIIPVYAEAIDFDDFDAGGTTSFAAFDRYRSEGLIFIPEPGEENSTIPIADVLAVEGSDAFGRFKNIGGTAPNVLALNNVGSGVNEIEASFVLPGTDTPAKTDRVEVLVFDGNIGTELAVLEAFDIDGNLVDAATDTTRDNFGGTLVVSHPNISRIRLSVDADGADFDNLTFNDLTPIGVGGSVTGFQVLEVSCQNQTTGQKIKLDAQESVTFWDCAAAGLETEPGDKIKIDLRGEAN